LTPRSKPVVEILDPDYGQTVENVGFLSVKVEDCNQPQRSLQMTPCGVETGDSGGSVNRDPRAPGGPERGDTKIKQENNVGLLVRCIFRNRSGHLRTWRLGRRPIPH